MTDAQVWATRLSNTMAFNPKQPRGRDGRWLRVKAIVAALVAHGPPDMGSHKEAAAAVEETRAKVEAIGPEGVQLVEFAKAWSGNSNKDDTTAIRASITERYPDVPRIIAASNAPAPTLWRMTNWSREDWPAIQESHTPGEIVDFGDMAAFSQNKTWASNFIQWAESEEYHGFFGHVFYTLEEGVGLPLYPISNLQYEREWLVNGKYEVVSAEMGKMDTDDTLMVTLRPTQR